MYIPKIHLKTKDARMVCRKAGVQLPKNHMEMVIAGPFVVEKVHMNYGPVRYRFNFVG